MDSFIRRYTTENTIDCEHAIHWFEKNIHMASPGRVRDEHGQVVIKEAKESLDISLCVEDLYTIPCFENLLNSLWKSILAYIKEFKLDGFNFSMTEKVNIQKYIPPNGGFKEYHCERSCVNTTTRMLVWMIYLNDLTDAGGTHFKYLNHTEDAVKGKILIWPPDFTHTHKGVVSPTQSKYIITGWYNFI
jgi:prolyl 4-hydroxylase